MEIMKIEKEKSEYDRLKSREEKYLAYMDMLSYRGEDKTYVDALCGKVAQLEEENKKLKSDNKRLREGVDAGQKIVEDLISKNKNLKEEIADLMGQVDGKQMKIEMLEEELKKYKSDL